MRIFVFQKWFTVTKLNGCLIPEDGRSFWKRNKPLFPGPCGNPVRQGCLRQGGCFCGKPTWQQDRTRKRSWGLRGALRFQAWADIPRSEHWPDPSKPSGSGWCLFGGSQAEADHYKANAAVHTVSVSISHRSPSLQFHKNPL